MILPTATDYLGAVQTPGIAFEDPALKQSCVRTNPLGLPLSWSGAFATVFQIQDPWNRTHAVRCFTRHADGLAERYRAFQAFRAKAPAKVRCYLVGADYLERGIRLPGSTSAGPWFPIIRMDWAEGIPLDAWVAEHLGEPQRLRWLQGALWSMSQAMASAAFVHGDIQHKNILITSQGPVLVDYDNVAVPGMPLLPSTTGGIPGFCHPSAQAQSPLAARDRFALLVLHVALEVIIQNPYLYRWRGPVEGLLFQGRDFDCPEASDLFHVLYSNPALKPFAQQLLEVCHRDPGAVPSLDQLFPSPPAPIHGAPSGPPPLSLLQVEALAKICLSPRPEAPLPRRGAATAMTGPPTFTLKQLKELAEIHGWNTPKGPPQSGLAATSSPPAVPAPRGQQAMPQPRRHPIRILLALLFLVGMLGLHFQRSRALKHPASIPLASLRQELRQDLDQRKDRLIPFIVNLDEQMEQVRNLPEDLQLARLGPDGKASSISAGKLLHSYALTREEARQSLIRCDPLLTEFDALARDRALDPRQRAARLAALQDLPEPIRTKLQEMARSGGVP